jgi:hypothetical protein
MKRLFPVLATALTLFAAAAPAQQPVPQPLTDSAQIKDTIRQLATSGGSQVTLELRPSSIPLVFGADFDSHPQDLTGPPGAQAALKRLQQEHLVGRVTQADDRDFKFQRGGGGLELTLYYDDVQRLTLPQVRPWTPPTKAEKVIEGVLSYPFRLIHALLLGGLCEW